MFDVDHAAKDQVFTNMVEAINCLLAGLRCGNAVQNCHKNQPFSFCAYCMRLADVED